MKKPIFKGEFSLTGTKDIDIPELQKQWNHLWYISQYGEEYRIIKCLRKDSAITDMKISITPETAHEIIKILGLEEQKSSVFRLASSWRKPEHWLVGRF